MSHTSQFADFEDSLLDLLAADSPRKTVQVGSIHHYPKFSQQLTVLKSAHPDFSDSQSSLPPELKPSARLIDLML